MYAPVTRHSSIYRALVGWLPSGQPISTWSFRAPAVLGWNAKKKTSASCAIRSLERFEDEARRPNARSGYDGRPLQLVICAVNSAWLNMAFSAAVMSAGCVRCGRSQAPQGCAEYSGCCCGYRWLHCPQSSNSSFQDEVPRQTAHRRSVGRPLLPILSS
jgi:hypothetical protein